MDNNKVFLFFISLCVFFLCSKTAEASQEPDDYSRFDTLLEMSLEELVELQVTIATGTIKPLKSAPAIASVITEDDIKNMGATTLSEALETVPGLHISPSQLNRLDDIISIRGIHTGFNPHVLFLMNGQPFTQSYSGGRPFTFTLPVANISRIEIIRGPGSAVYGADAFAGTINIITKDGKDINGTDIGLRYGSFDSTVFWLQHGTVYNGWDLSLSIEYLESEEDKSRIVDQDLQTSLDEAINIPVGLPPASNAPESLQTDYKILDTHLAASKGNWTAKFWGWFQDDAGLGAGGSQAIDTEGYTDVEQYLADIAYHNKDLHKDWDINLRARYLYREEDSYFVLFPPGTILPIGSDGNIDLVKPAGVTLFTDGYIGFPIIKESQTTIEGAAYYKGFTNHLLRAGTGYKHLKEDHEHYSNFGPSVINGSQPVVDGTLYDLSGTAYAYMPDVTRDIMFLSLQDEWIFAENWELTAGIRYDNYSDFGDTINPRLALVWKTSNDLTTKLLYGRAFRPPSFAELYAQNNPVVLGNRELSPETIDTFEISVDYKPTSKLRIIPSIFAYDIRDIIDHVPDNGQTTKTAQNTRNQKGHGFELEAQWLPTDTLFIKGNLAYQNSEDKDTGEPVPDAPAWQAYLNANWRFLPEWSFDAQYFWIADRERAAGDTRKNIKDNNIVNLTLRCTNIFKNWEGALAVRNLFDEDIREPSTSAIPNDYPMEERSIWAELRFNF